MDRVNFKSFPSERFTWSFSGSYFHGELLLNRLAVTGFEQIDKQNRTVVVMQQYQNTYTVSKHHDRIIINAFCRK